MGSMGRPIQPKKVIIQNPANKGRGAKAGVPAAHLGEIKRVCAKCGHIWMAKPNPFAALKCPKCKTIIVR